MSVQLTPQQEAVVRHDEGPALVFAVAGAGKTTAMVHRIARLVDDGVFPAERILATTFARQNAADLRQSLAPWPACAAVRVTTLHALGRGLIRRAVDLGVMRGVRLDGAEDGEGSVLTATVAMARADNVAYKAELETLDRADFLSYVAACKGDLAYPDPEAVDLPADARALIRPAPPVEGALSYYVDLYARFERVRQARGIVTFPDMLLSGWEILIRSPEIAALAQEQFQAVLVDEFQDVNLAQAEILDILTRPGRNYMAIGDDDQTIYEWRGARTDFILQFARRYAAQTYLISENFRCPAGPLALANAVIAHNVKRESKRLRLTQGFSGTTDLEVSRDAREQAGAVLARIQKHAAAGLRLDDMAVLVRLNAQTPPIEQALIRAGVPYRVRQPFYERLEIRTLIDYVRLAWLERRLVAGTTSAGQRQAFTPAWETVCNRPKRYLGRELRRGIGEFVVRHARPLAEVLRAFTLEAPNDGVAAYLETLADDITWLAASLDHPAAVALDGLERRLQYRQFLRDTSGFAQTGEGRAVGVAAFLEFAQNQGTLLEFMAMIRGLAEARVGQQTAGGPAVALATIHQAKGREWPVVILPQVNQGLVPFVNERSFNLEEERRLFYVALTRSRRHLHLFVTGDRPFSPFLGESGAAELMRGVEAMAAALARPPAAWTAADALALLRGAAAYGLESYFRAWWDDPPSVRAAVSGRALALLRQAEAAGLAAALDLPAGAGELWAELAPSPPRLGAPFADLEEHLARRRRPAANAGLPAPLDRVAPGVWLRCDAGWAMVKTIVDAQERPLPSVPAEAGAGRIRAVLRPGPHQERIEIDLAARRIYFPRQRQLFSCARCHGFTTADPFVLAGRHDPVAHSGVGSQAVRHRQSHIRLTRLTCHAGPPPTPFA